MSKKECLHQNINDKENLSSTSKFYSTKIGWADIDDALIDSSISRALESLKKNKICPRKKWFFLQVGYILCHAR